MKKPLPIQKINLRPYIGTLYVTRTQAQFRSAYKRLFADDDCGLSDNDGGRYIRGPHRQTRALTYLVWAEEGRHMVHELAHVVLDLFETVGVAPCSSGGEAFCYMLGKLCEDVGIKI